jgi:hypothetical protein
LAASSFPLVLGPTERRYLPAVFALALVVTRPCAPAAAFESSKVTLTVLEDRAQSWRSPLPDDELRGLRLLYDTPIPGGSTLAIVRWIVRSNHRLDPFDALVLATRAVAIAQEHHLPVGLFCSLLLQESGFSQDAVSPAGAVGIAQFSLDTAADEGVDPFDPEDAMRGSARLLGRYVAAYDGVYADPYAAALAAYNAGPGYVDEYHGIPPFPETRGYIDDIYDRWARILRDATGLRPSRLKRHAR